MKSQFNVPYAEVVQAVLQDCSAAYPKDAREFRRDSERIAHLYRSRGKELFLEFLPLIEKALVQGLHDSSLPRNFFLCSRKGPSSKLPKFLWGLWSKIFDNEGCLLEDPDVNAIFFIRQICLVWKKFILPCHQQTLNEVANEYKAVDSALPLPVLNWEEDFINLDSLDDNRLHISHLLDRPNDLLEFDFQQSAGGSGSKRDDGTRLEEQLLKQFQTECDRFADRLQPFNPISEFCTRRQEKRVGSGFKHGPGAVASGNAHTDKYAFPYWSNKLSRTFPYAFGRALASDDMAGRVNHELPARLIDVPKTRSKPRLIAAEPVEHQWCQQMILSYLTRSIETSALRYNIDLKRQDLSKSAAQLASLDGHLATVDLSSASDRLSCRVVESAFRRNPSLLKALHASRTRWIVNSIRGTEKYYLKLRKFASQGTAVTFPVQSIVFTLAARSVLRSDMRNYRENCKKVRVYGDDIIIPVQWYDRLAKLLHLLGLKVNHDKSFYRGFFRESCGGDYYRGYDVTPVKISRYDPTTPEGAVSLRDTTNNLFYKGLWHVSEFCRMDLPEALISRSPIFQSVPWDSRTLGGGELSQFSSPPGGRGSPSGLPGFVSFCGSDYRHLKMRWNPHSSSVEYLTWATSSKRRSKDRVSESRLRMFFFERPFWAIDYSSDIPLRPQTREGLRWRSLPHDGKFAMN